MQDSNIVLQASRNGLSVPVINGVYLHSIFNPSKEAETFAENNIEIIKAKSKILILGLGFGYHIEEVAKQLHKYHTEYEIVVVEPNQGLVNLFNEKRPFIDNNIKVMTVHDLDEIYSNYEFSTFLMTRPGILKLDTSFQINKTFYTSLLTFKSRTKVSDYKSKLSSASLKLIGDETDSFHEVVNKIKKKQVLNNKNNFLLLALSEISKTDNEVTQ